MTFGDLQSMDRFFLSIGGHQFEGQKIASFTVLSPQRNSHITINARLTHRNRVVEGTEGFVASIPDSLAVDKAA